MSGRVSAPGNTAGARDGRGTSRVDGRGFVTSPAPPGGSAIRSDPSRDETYAWGAGKGMERAPPRTTPPCGRPRHPREAIAGGAPTWCPSSFADARFGDAPSARGPVSRARVARVSPERGGLLGTARRGGCQNGTDHDFPIRPPVARARGSCRRLSLRDSSARRAFPTGQRRSARTIDATQTMSETARSAFLGDTMPHILPVRAFSPRRASFPAPTSHFWHSRAGDWDALAFTSDSAPLPRILPTHPSLFPTTRRPAHCPRATPRAPRRASNPRSASRPSAPPPPPRSESAFPFRRATRDDRFQSRPRNPVTRAPIDPVTRAPIDPVTRPSP